MPSRGTFHEAVRHALITDGWTITHDPFSLRFGHRDVFVDLGAERLLAAEKQNDKIAVEIKGFLGASEMHDLEVAIGQFVFYRSLLSRVEPDRKLFLAVPDTIFETTLTEPIARPVLEDLQVSLLAFNVEREVITRWKK